MESGPLPPHERSWRHPSEIAAATRQEIRTERPSRLVRAAALVGGTSTAVLMGLFVLSITPERMQGPVVTSSTPIDHPDAVGDLGDQRAIGVVQQLPLATVMSVDGTAVVPSAAVIEVLAGIPANVAPPLTRSGVMIERISSDRPRRGPLLPHIEVLLGDGSRHLARLIDPGNGTGLAVIQLLAEGHRDAPGHETRWHDSRWDDPPGGEPIWDALPLREQPLDADSVVTVMTPVPDQMALVDLVDRLNEPRPAATGEPPYPDGTPVVDDDGQLVGVLVVADDGMSLATVGAPRTDDAGGQLVIAPDDATSPPPPRDR